MPVLPDARYELFAQARAKGETADKAYVTAGFKRNDSNAARLNGNERIQARVAELLAETAAKVQSDLAWDAKKLFTMVRGVYDTAIDEKDLRTALDAAKFIIECFGYKDSPTLTHEHMNGKPMTPAEKSLDADRQRIVRFAPAAEAIRKARAAHKSDVQE